MPDPIFFYYTDRLSRISENSIIHEYRTGDISFENNDPPTNFYGVIHGQIQLSLIFKDDVVTRKIQCAEVVSTRMDVHKKNLIFEQIKSHETVGWLALVEPGLGFLIITRLVKSRPLFPYIIQHLSHTQLSD